MPVLGMMLTSQLNLVDNFDLLAAIAKQDEDKCLVFLCRDPCAKYRIFQQCHCREQVVESHRASGSTKFRCTSPVNG
jgi:hypothetical protein